jgi:16S rRNA (cytosine1402-N4)-methyltransferase
MRLHKPVLLQEAVNLLQCKDGGVYVDCTVGMGGHSEKILEASQPHGFLLGLDRDREAIAFAKERLAAYSQRVKLVQANYKMLSEVLESNQVPSPSGILVDMGPSLLQFTEPERGFSFSQNGPLDMRMDQTQGETARDIVNSRSLAELTRIFREFGEERSAYRIATKIVEQREQSSLNTTEELRKLIEKAVPRRRNQKIHPATKTFQALRIAVNHELEGLDTFIFDAFDSLSIGGRLVMISFHSLEDRIIKQAFQFLSAACRCSKRFAVCQCGGEPLSTLVVHKPIRPSKEEVAENPASRSAKLRAIEKRKAPAQREFWNEWKKERA